jgi:hypothetical protein
VLHSQNLANADVAAIKPAMFHERTFRQEAPGSAR